MGGELEKTVEVIYPEEPRCALVLLLDTSSSMGEYLEGARKIDELNEGIKILKEELMEDELARKRVEIEVITFGGANEVNIFHKFSSVDEFNPENLKAYGVTPMGKAILRGIEEVESRKRYYKEKGIEYYRPWLWLITDGMPTDMNVGDDMWNRVVREVHEGEKQHKFTFWAVGVGGDEGADMEKLKMIAPPNRIPVKLKGVKFKEMFSWLSKSLRKVSASKPGEQVEFGSIEEWAEGWTRVDRI